jgi:PAS domain S-box-containing protein
MAIPIDPDNQSDNAVLELDPVLGPLLAERSLSGIVLTDGEFRILYANPAFARLCGGAREGMRGRGLPDLIDAEGRGRLMSEGSGSGESGRRGTYRLLREDGLAREVEILTSAVTVGSRVYRLHALADVTERVKAERALRSSEERFRVAAELASDFIYEWSWDDPEVFWYSKIDQLLGYEPGEFPRDLASNNATVHRDDRARMLAAVRDHVEHGTPFDLEYRALKKDGSYITIHSRACALHNEQGKMVRWIGVNTDITDQRRMERALRASEERFRIAAELVSDYIYEWSLDNPEMLWFSKVDEPLGYPPGEFPRRLASIMAAIHRDDRGKLQAAIRDQVLDGKPFAIEYRVRKKDGSYLTVANRAQAVRNERGEMVRLIGVSTDVTLRRRIEAELREAEEKWRTFITDSAYGYVEFDLTGNFTFVNPRGTAISGYRLGDVPNFRDIIVPDDLPRAMADLARVGLEPNEGPQEYRLRHRDGSILQAEVNTLPLRREGRLVGYQSTVLDVTARWKAEAELKRREAVLKVVAHAAEQFLLSADWRSAIPGVLEQVGRILDLSRVYVFERHPGPGGEALASDRHEWTDGRCGSALSHPRFENVDFAAMGAGNLLHVLETGQVMAGLVRDLPPFEQEFLRPLGLISYLIVPIMATGAWRGFIGFDDCRAEQIWSPAEIDALRALANSLGAAILRREADAALAESESKFRLVVENLSDVLWVLNEKAKPVFISPSINILLGYSPEEARALGPAGLLTPDSLQRWRAVFEETVAALEEEKATGALPIIPTMMDLEMVRRDGDHIWVEAEWIFRRDPAGNFIGFQGTFHDITARRRSEQELKRREAILRVVAEAAETFLRTGDWRERIDLVLARLGRSLEASRVFIFQNHPGLNGATLASRILEWADHGIKPQLQNPKYRELDLSAAGHSEFLDGLAQGQPQFGLARDLAPHKREYVADAELICYLAVPIFVGQNLWGYLGLDECRRERVWSSGETDILKTLAGTIGAAIARQEDERALAESGQRYRMVVENVSDVIWIADASGRPTFVSRAILNLLGYDEKEALKLDPAQFIAEESRRAWLNLYDRTTRAIAEEKATGNMPDVPQHLELEMVHRDGQTVWVEASWMFRRDHAGDVIGYQGVFHDVTDRRRIEIERARREALLQIVTEAAEILLRTADWREHIEPIIARTGRALGVSRLLVFENRTAPDRRVLSSPWRVWEDGVTAGPFDPEKNQDLDFEEMGFGAMVQKLSRGEVFAGHLDDLPGPLWGFFNRLRLKSVLMVPLFVGEAWWGFFAFEECRQPRVWTAAEIDILKTLSGAIGAAIQRQEAEQAIAESESKYRLVVENIRDVIWTVDLELRLTYLSPSMEGMLGYTAEEMLGQSPLQYLAPESRRHLGESYRRALKAIEDKPDPDSDPASPVIELQMIRKNGSLIWTETVWSYQLDAYGQVIGGQGMTRDITKRKQAEDDIKLSEERMRAQYNAIPVPTYTWKKQGEDFVLVDYNEAAVKFTRGIVKKYIGAKASIFYQDKPDIIADFERCIRERSVFEREINYYFHSQKEMKFIGAKYAFLAPDLIIAHAEDLTEKKKTMEALAEAERRLQRTLTAEVHHRRSKDFSGIHGGEADFSRFTSAPMQRVLEEAKIAAGSDGNALLLGPSGVGKTYLAAWIHQHSRRADGPFFDINCTALNPSLIESELFGHEAGAFTGSKGRKRGLIELADSGTLFLDEIGDMPLDLQAKLLNFLDTRKLMRLGAETKIHVDTRIIVATNRDLAQRVEDARFREDLYYRLNVLAIVVPPLRERKQDIPLLASEILAVLAPDMGLKIPPVLGPEAIRNLIDYEWPGNVRELRNVLERVLLRTANRPVIENIPILRAITSTPTIAAHLGASEPPSPSAITENFDQAVDSYMIKLISAAISATKSKVEAAKLLGISRHALNRYVKKFNLDARF